MTEKKSLVEETLIQMKDLENVISENAKGILQSTMKEEIGELVKESLMEQSEEDVDDESEIPDLGPSDDEDEMQLPSDDEDDEDEMQLPSDDEDDEDDEDEMQLTSDDEPIDLTGASDEEILKVFKGMGEDDGIIVKKDGNYIDLEDTEEDVEYKIQLGESDDFLDSMMGDQNESSETMYELEINDPDTNKGIYDLKEFDDEMEIPDIVTDKTDEEEMSLIDFNDDDSLEMGDIQDSTIYEIDLGNTDEYSEDPFTMESFDSEYQNSENDLDITEFYDSEEDNIKEIDDPEELDLFSNEDDDFPMGMVQDDIIPEGFKSKKFGVKGKGPKFTWEKTPEKVYPKMKEGPKSVGTGSAKKFKYSDGENAGSKLGKNKIVKKSETKEAARTYGNGSNSGRGLKKGITPNRNLNFGKGNLRTESQEIELNLLREKNEEYRKALNLFRGKLNEVAVFNSNLAYATRLFTEHSTTKQEKINILRRFDSVENLKESKTLYKTIKDELSSQTSNKPSKESIQEQIERSPSSGSAASLIESKTYENPQFLRMKDLMVKMNIKK